MTWPSATSADSAAHEGKFFTSTKQEPAIILVKKLATWHMNRDGREQLSSKPLNPGSPLCSLLARLVCV